MWLAVGLLCIVICPLVLSDCSPCDRNRNQPKFNFVAQRVPFRRPPFVARADATISVRETAGKPLPICPCVKEMATGQCISYDSRYLAVDLQEAIVDFPDLTMIHVQSNWDRSETDTNGIPLSAQPYSIQGSNEQPLIKPVNAIMAKSFATTLKPAAVSLPPLEGACKGLECLFCSDLLTRRLKQLGLLDEEKFATIRQKLGLNQLGDIYRVVGQMPCKRFNFAMPNKPPFANLMRRVKQRVKESNGTFANFLRTVSEAGLHTWNNRHHEGMRVRREAGKLGTSYKLDCIRRGQSIDGTEWLGLCNVCWVWRRLPPDYFPQYVNELICDEDTKCLSGWGTCKQRQRSMEVLRNVGTADEPVWKSVTINTANFCDCFVQSGTVMHTFIAA
uniref:Saposin B-type domain-containing protein n=1 Tax=Trichuris muris TaxID=70415 RepID=A0A5S6QNC9_TRIMR